MYEDKFGITKIRDDKRDNLGISIDIMSEPVAVLMYIPDVDDFEHSHIELTRKQATILRDWLIKFLDDDIEKKYEEDLKRENV
jgi:hypothetical protein